MVDTIIFHLPGDIERAQWLAKAWDDRRGLALPIHGEARTVQFGPHVFVLGVLTPGHGAAEIETLVRTIAQARPRGVIMTWNGAPAPEIAASCGVPVIAGTSEPADDIDLLRQIARAVDRGLFIPSDYTAPPPAAARRVAAAPVKLAVAAGRAAEPAPMLAPALQPSPRPPAARGPRLVESQAPPARRKGRVLPIVTTLAVVLIAGVAVAAVVAGPSLVQKFTAWRTMATPAATPPIGAGDD